MPKNTFRIGLCMAGAVSAGSYTAGVIDYLLEALETWQKRKDANSPNTPDHHVEISVIGGASAGGMTGIVTAAALQDEIIPIRKALPEVLKERPENKLYHSWVDMEDRDMLKILLNTNDFKENDELDSVLNSEFIEKIADRAMLISPVSKINRAYISKQLKVFVTLSNLQGMRYPVDFKSSTSHNQYYIITHNDYSCFKLCDTEADYSDDGWIPLNFRSGMNTSLAKDAAMATGAFPIGLKSRVVSRKKSFLNDLSWFDNITKTAGKPFEIDPYVTMNVDGGMINNEPFERVFEQLKEETYPHREVSDDAEEIKSSEAFKSTVLMIDPFPNEDEPNEFDKNSKLTKILGDTLSAMINQSRLKPKELIEALEPDNYKQFLIAPVRYAVQPPGKEIKIEGKKAIACGDLGGFSGFVNKEFRVHDYFLGRANCERFLRHYFTVPADTENVIFADGYRNTDKSKFLSKDGELPIIPIFTEEQGLYMPKFSNGKTWPTVTSDFIRSYRKPLKKRIEKILFNITEYSKTQWILLWIGAKVLINGKLAESVIKTVISSLKEHELIR